MRKFDSIVLLQNLGLKVAEAQEFAHHETDKTKSYANYMVRKYGKFGLRTDLAYSHDPRSSMNLPFAQGLTSFEELERLLKDYGPEFSYIIYEDVDTSHLVANCVGELLPGRRFDVEINAKDKTALRHAMGNAPNLRFITIANGAADVGKVETEPYDTARHDIPEDIVKNLWIVRGGLIKRHVEGLVEFSLYDDDSAIYWQLRKGI